MINGYVNLPEELCDFDHIYADEPNIPGIFEKAKAIVESKKPVYALATNTVAQLNNSRITAPIIGSCAYVPLLNVVLFTFTLRGLVFEFFVGPNDTVSKA